MKAYLIYPVAIPYLALAGCCTPPEPITITETVEIQVPVLEKCQVEMPRRMPYATESLSKEDTDFEKIRALLVELRERQGTEEELRILLASCLN